MTPLTYLQAFAALLFVVALIGLVGWAYRRYGGRMLGGGTLTGKRRLAVVESLAIDARHRLVLVSRDGTEHLLVVGADATAVVESGIPAAYRPGSVDGVSE